MPTYEYVCRECGQHLEVVQSFKDDPLDTCERCGGPLRKVFSAAGIIFKGSGYYVTDSRSDRVPAGSSSGTSDTSAKSSASASSGSESSDGASADRPSSDSSSKGTGGSSSSNGAASSDAKSA